MNATQLLKLTYRFVFTLSVLATLAFPVSAAAEDTQGDPIGTGEYAPVQAQETVVPVWPELRELDYRNATPDCSSGVCGTYDNGWLTNEAQLQDIDAMWSQKFAAAGIEYRSPKAYYFDSEFEFETGCGWIEAGAFAFYCSADEALYFNPDALDALFIDYGAYAVTNVLAHEFAHHIQYLSGVEPTSVELQANCLVGVYWADADSRGMYEPHFSQGSLDYMGVGSWEDVDPAYGTPGDQQEQWMAGYDEGTEACGLPT